MNLWHYGRQHEDIVGTGRGWNYLERGSVLAHPITGIVGWPPTGDVYARTTDGKLVLLSHGPDPAANQRADQDKHLPMVPTFDELKTWVRARGWWDAARAMVVRMAAQDDEARDRARESWQKASGRGVDWDVWLDNQWRDVRDGVSGAFGGAGDLVAAGVGLYVAWRVVDLVLGKRR